MGGESSGAGGPSRPGFGSWLRPGGRRRAALAAGVIVVCGLVALPLVAFGGPGKPRSALVFTSVPPTTTAPSATDAATTTTVAPAPVPTTAPPSTTQKASTTPTTALACHNSYNAACGTFRWSPAPAPADAWTMRITPSDSQPVAGQEVTFTVTYSDPNAAVVTDCPTAVEYGDMSLSTGCSIDTQCTTRYGAWAPPPKHPSSGTIVLKHTYTSPGPYTVTVKYPAGVDCYDPYRDVLSASLPITVTAAPASTTSTTTG